MHLLRQRPIRRNADHPLEAASATQGVAGLSESARGPGGTGAAAAAIRPRTDGPPLRVRVARYRELNIEVEVEVRRFRFLSSRKKKCGNTHERAPPKLRPVMNRLDLESNLTWAPCLSRILFRTKNGQSVCGNTGPTGPFLGQNCVRYFVAPPVSEINRLAVHTLLNETKLLDHGTAPLVVGGGTRRHAVQPKAVERMVDQRHERPARKASALEERIQPAAELRRPLLMVHTEIGRTRQLPLVVQDDGYGSVHGCTTEPGPSVDLKKVPRLRQCGRNSRHRLPATNSFMISYL